MSVVTTEVAVRRGRNERRRTVFFQPGNGSTFQTSYHEIGTCRGIIKHWGLDIKHLATGLKSSDLGRCVWVKICHQ